MIMLYPVVPGTMEKVKETLKLDESVWRISEFGTGMSPGHKIGEMTVFPLKV